jgi:hypothetical protein
MLTRLEPGWDTYRAEPPTRAALGATLRTIEALSLFLRAHTEAWREIHLGPSLERGAEFEWRTRGKEMQIWIDADGQLSMMRFIGDGDCIDGEDGIQLEPPALATYVNWMLALGGERWRGLIWRRSSYAASTFRSGSMMSTGTG